jgi:microcystin degradation protein MlrC
LQVAHQNPVPSSSRDFDISRGTDLLAFGKRTYIGGAISVLSSRQDLELVPVYAAGGPSAGVLEHSSFLEMAGELLDGVRAAQADHAIDGVYFSMHGAMATFEEHDPEGWLLEHVRVSTTHRHGVSRSSKPTPTQPAGWI